jgi:hypothetical protein
MQSVKCTKHNDPVRYEQWCNLTNIFFINNLIHCTVSYDYIDLHYSSILSPPWPNSFAERDYGSLFIYFFFLHFNKSNAALILINMMKENIF